ncbi:host-nuclease inhibitor Gam family protein [Halalkalibacterium ligniniphilum]|uniref:host-nuclease inhibitor Gam family protein n=1 Tax=Halalkalibacterium ligniniphilum TaxID=1134413 RepID=UPI00034BFBEF|nr:host-nuclease inhibitor Gam family protein [Halalkalibacterium ligniniphilum]
MSERTKEIRQGLEDVMEGFYQEEQQQEVFEVMDLESAAEAQRRVGYFKEQQAQIDEIAQKQIEPFLKKIEKIKTWAEEAKKEFVEREQFYTHRLEFYMREEVKRQMNSGKKPKKTIKLPYGQIKLVKQQPEFRKDENELLNYAKANGFIKVTESADWAEIKKRCSVLGDKLIDENGEVIPGVTVVERDDKFSLVLED